MLYIHVVWATDARRPLLTAAVEADVYKLILTKVQAAGYEVLALNGMPDHVHLVLRCGSHIDLSQLMKTVKGTSAAMVNEMQGARHAFRWQEGYYAATITPSHVPKIRAYVENQKAHHADNTASRFWEQTGDDPGVGS
jgi:REP element-mobilizing transposase RayT